MSDPLTDIKWYALYTKPRSEKKLVEDIKKNFTLEENVFPFIPIVYKKQKNRNKILSLPMIPSYIFIKTHLDHDIWYKLINNHNTVSFVTKGNQPCQIPDYEIESLKIIMENAKNTNHKVTLEKLQLKGKLVKITCGPFEGIIGKVTTIKENRKRIFVNIEHIHTSISIEVDAELVEKVELYE